VKTRVPALDGLRGIAIAAVVTYHATKGQIIGGGFFGVDLFFVLSGYLITGLLLRESAETGTIALRRFYRRRARRLLPALGSFLAVLGAVGCWAAVTHRITWGGLAITGVGSLYLTNLARLVGGLGAGGTWIVHLWSLSEEEQFYLLWPVVLIGALRTNATTAQLRVLLGSFLVLSVAAEHTGSSNFDQFYYSPVTHSSPIILGCLLAITPIRVPGGLLIGGALFAAALLFASPSTAPYLAWQPVALIGSALLVAHASGNRLLQSGPLVGLGLISYSLYLWHFPLVIRFGPSAIPAAVLLAMASYRFVEKPWLNRASRPAATKPLVTGRVASPGLSPVDEDPRTHLQLLPSRGRCDLETAQCCR